MLWEIFKFELKYRWKRPATYIYFAIMFFVPFFAVISDNVVIGGAAGQVKDNAPENISYMVLIMSAIIGLLLAAGVMGVPVIRDYEHKTSSLFFSNPINKFQYLGGRFLGSFVTAAFIFSGIIWGMMAGHLSPWVEDDKLLPFNFWHYMQPYLTIALTNLFIMSGVFFAAGALTKKMLVVFTQGIGLMVGYQIGVNMVFDLDNQMLAALIDPFGAVTHDYVTQYWTVTEKNTQLVPLAGALLTNRLIWMGVSVLALLATYFFFNFSVSRKSKKQKLTTPLDLISAKEESEVIIPKVTQYEGFGTAIKQMFGMSWFYFKWITRQAPFIAMVLAGMGMTLMTARYWNRVYEVFQLPTTYSVLELISSFNLFFVIIIVMYCGELVWKERDVKMNLIYDALPFPNFVTLTGKFLSMVYVFAILLFILMLTGMSIQAYSGYFDFQVGLYIKTLFTETFSFLLLFTILGFMFQSLVNNKFMGHAIFVVFFIVMEAASQLGLEHSLFQFGYNNLGQYSDMNSFGHYVPRFSWYSIYWFALAGILFVLALLFATRGAETDFLMRYTKK